MICTDPSSNQSIGGTGDRKTSSTGRCIGMTIHAEDVNVVNFMCEGAHTGIEVVQGGAYGHGIQSVALSNIRISGARGSDGTGAGIYWPDQDGIDNKVSGLSQLGPFHITDCDRGIEVLGQYLRGSGFIRDCDHGLYFKDQATANQTWLDVMFFNNGDNASPGVS